jgi:membrane protease YdiL (CAAX protease family)
MDDLSPSPPGRPGAPVTDWPVWTAPLALLSGLLLAALAGVVVDLPAAALGVKITTSHVPPGIEIADTAVQDAAFVLAAVIFAQIGGRTVHAWQFGLRPTRFWRAVGLVAATLCAFLLFSLVWDLAFHVQKEKLLEKLGANDGTVLLLLSAGLTCVVAPICEELLFRGFIFTALRNWKGTWPAAVLTGLVFGAVHGFGLCLLYRRTGSLYPCTAAHSLNNSLAFGVLEEWDWQILVLAPAALAVIGLLGLVLTRTRVIAAEGSAVPSGA